MPVFSLSRGIARPSPDKPFLVTKYQSNPLKWILLIPKY